MFKLTAIEEPLVPGIYRIVSKHNNTVIDLASCSASNGANIQTYTWLNNDCQKWSVEDTFDGNYLKFRSTSNGKVIDLPSCSNNNGTNIQQWTSFNNDCQKWLPVPVGNDYFKIESKSSGQVMDIQGSGTQGNILQWPYNGVDWQKWKFEELVIGWDSNQNSSNKISTATKETTSSNIDLETEIKIVPNPSNGFIKITGLVLGKINKLEVMDLSGRLVLDTKIYGSNHTLNITNLKKTGILSHSLGLCPVNQ